MFSEEQFQEACNELETQNLEGYDFFTESHGVKIYRSFNKDSGLYQYKVYGVLQDLSPELGYEVYMDLKYRKKWDGYVKELYEIEGLDSPAIYWRVAFPFPMSHRDYVYERDVRELDIDGQKHWIVLARATQTDKVPPVKGVIRVTDYIQEFVLTSDGEGGSKAFMHYYDNPGGSIPTWLINWAAKSGVPGFLKDMKKACKKYAEYKTSNT